MDERRFGILVGEEDGPSAILMSWKRLQTRSEDYAKAVARKRRKRIVGRGVKWLAAYACLDGVGGGGGGWWGGDSRFHTDLV